MDAEWYYCNNPIDTCNSIKVKSSKDLEYDDKGDEEQKSGLTACSHAFTLNSLDVGFSSPYFPQ